jgi:DNA-binding CsgD family transcriptional regulator/tetratricopeptide (TPR) repeat protein
MAHILRRAAPGSHRAGSRKVSPLPPKGNPLRGRADELAQLAGLLSDAADGRGGAALVSGPAGIGKTSLLAATVAAADGFEVLQARGGALERDFAFGLVRGLLEPLRRRDDLDELLRGAAALARPFVDPRATAAAADEHATRHGLYWLCAELAERRPLLVVADDAHWADAPSLRFLVHLARRVEDLPLALLVAARPAEPGDQGTLLGALAGEPAVRPVGLVPLSRDAVGELARDALGDAVPAGLADACHEAAAGNPFLVVSSLRALRREAPERWSPDRLRELAAGELSVTLAARLEGVRALGLARAAAVLGARAGLRHARALAELDEPEAARQLDVLVAQDVLGAPAFASSAAASGEFGAPVLQFVHPLVRAAVYESMPAGERALLHARAARLLTGDGHPPEEVAPHLLATAPGGRAWVSELLGAAAARALSAGAADLAVAYLRRALAEPAPEVARPALLADLGAAEVRLGLPEGIDHLRAARDAAPPGAARALAGRALAWALVPPGRYAEAIEALEAALAELGEGAGGQSPAGADRELALSLEADLSIAGRLDRRSTERTARRLERFEGRLAGDTPAERALLASLGMRRLMLAEDAPAAAALARRAFEGGLISEQGPDATPVYDLAYVLLVADELELAERAMTAAIDEARRRGSLLGFARASCFRAQGRWRAGALADAESDARACLEVATAHGWEVAYIGAAALCLVLLDRGRPKEAALVVGDEEVPDTFMRNFTLDARARLRLATGHREAAIADLRELARREDRWRGRNPGAFPHRSLLALAGEGSAPAEEELELARAWGAPRAIAVALLALGDRASLAEAVEVTRGSPARLVHAQSLVALGAHDRRAGERRAAREPLSAGLDLATRCGATGLAERAREELLATGARPRRPLRSGRDALTPSELRVVRLAASGLTNRQIAQTLFVTARTVEVHLTHAYAKLGVAGRGELAAALAD